MSASLTRTVEFQASHRLAGPGWTEQQNRERFGDLAAEHEHTYRCAVTVSGDLTAGQGMVVDLAELDRILTSEVVDRLSGTSLNASVPPFAASQFATCEALAAWLFSVIGNQLPAEARLERVRVAEDDTLHGDCTGLV